MTTREYILAAYPVRRRTRQMREIKERAGGMPSQVVLVVADHDAMDVLDALRRAYQDGREDRSAEVTDPRDLRAHLERQAATEQSLGDDYAESDLSGLEQAHRRYGRAEAYRDMIKHVEHELESP